MSTTVTMTYNIDSKCSYDRFICDLRETLAQHEDRQYVRDPRDRSVRYVLPRQRSGRHPARWIYVELVVDERTSTTLAIRNDNLYLIGFKNHRGEWFEFGHSGNVRDPCSRQWKKSKSILPEESTFLECDFDYGSIVDGALNLVNVELGRSAACQAVRQLSGYAQPPGATVDSKTRWALARLIVMFCEACRMRPHLATVRAGWVADTGRISRREVHYIWNWGDMSEALLRWREESDRFEFPGHLNGIGVTGAAQALDIVALLLNRPIHLPPPWERERHLQRQRPTGGDHGGPSEQQHQHQHKRPANQQWPAAGQEDRGSEQQQQSPRPTKRRVMEGQPPPDQQGSQNPQLSPGPGAAGHDDYVPHGQPLAEIFAVHANFHFLGTIAVFDGMRGQVIYENVDNAAAPVAQCPSSRSVSDEDDQSYAPLLLTGPYRAISAYGSFMIDFDIAGPATDAAELHWDCYEEEDYDVPVTKTITTTSGQKVKVTYAVFSDAVEANLEVLLRLPEATADESRRVICGEIAARSQAFEDSDQAWSVLFCSEEGVPPITDGSGSLPRLPLARSVVAMPLGCPMVIKATLYDAPPTQGAIPFLQSQDSELTLDHRTTTLRGENGRDVEVNITSPDLRPRAEPRNTETTRPHTCAPPPCS